MCSYAPTPSIHIVSCCPSPLATSDGDESPMVALLFLCDCSTHVASMSLSRGACSEICRMSSFWPISLRSVRHPRLDRTRISCPRHTQCLSRIFCADPVTQGKGGLCCCLLQVKTQQAHLLLALCRMSELERGKEKHTGFQHQILCW
ncbi:uncharacterized protein UBRO_20437 [Ustilago bromivora]|uniref:Uncharacterized protein n=1 Tax=Ustilago bromivora TaxID=307758 RepID=A0A1K0GWR2_9BASI|nr:uncharacterized protein UBRO_20437 [Ustilago bromivora]